MLEGKNVNLRIREKEDLPLIAEWVNNPEFWGEFFHLYRGPEQRWKRHRIIILLNQRCFL